MDIKQCNNYVFMQTKQTDISSNQKSTYFREIGNWLNKENNLCSKYDMHTFCLLNDLQMNTLFFYHDSTAHAFTAEPCTA